MASMCCFCCCCGSSSEEDRHDSWASVKENEFSDNESDPETPLLERLKAQRLQNQVSPHGEKHFYDSSAPSSRDSSGSYSINGNTAVTPLLGQRREDRGKRPLLVNPDQCRVEDESSPTQQETRRRKHRSNERTSLDAHVNREGLLLGQYFISKTLGRGTYLVEPERKSFHTYNHVVARTLKFSKTKANESRVLSMMGEFSRLQEVDHPNVLSLIGCKRHLDTIFLFYEYFLRCQPLEGYIKVNRLDDAIVIAMLRQIVEGLAYLHSKSIPHRGLRCASIYIDDKGSIKIGNTQNNPSKYRSAEEAAGCDNFRWLSPEARAGRVQSTESDMWSLGCTVIELLTGSPPVYDGVEQNEFQSLKGEIVARAVDRHDVSPRQVQLLLVEIVQHCLVSEKKERKSAAEIASCWILAK